MITTNMERAGNDNVVIAVLHDGEYSTVSATGVAREMLHSIPNLRIRLMIGIGGGAPNSKHGIRFGDIVVSNYSMCWEKWCVPVRSNRESKA